MLAWFKAQWKYPARRVVFILAGVVAIVFFISSVALLVSLGKTLTEWSGVVWLMILGIAIAILALVLGWRRGIHFSARQVLGAIVGVIVVVFLVFKWNEFYQNRVERERQEVAMQALKFKAIASACKLAEDSSSVRYEKVARPKSPAVDTIPMGWNLQKWTDEASLERKVSRRGTDLVEVNTPKAGVDSVVIGFRLYRNICGVSTT